MRDRQSLMSEIGAALQFFDGFGENWYALEECLSYLDEWLPADAYVLVIEKAEEILVDDDDAFTDFLKSVNGAGEFWSRPVTSPDRFVRAAIPFHMLLNVSDSDAVSIERIARLAASADVGIDVTESGQYS